MSGSNDWDAVTSTGGAAPVDEVRSHDLMHGLDERADIVGSPLETSAQDPNGNMIWDNDYDLTYDAYNHLRRVIERSTGDLIAEYSYDAQDRRITKAVTNSGSLDGVTHLVYDAEDVIAEYDDSGNLLREFVHGPGYGEPLIMDRNTGLDQNATEATDERYYYLHDALGSVAGIRDDAGDLVEGYLYEPYGQMYVVLPGSNGEVDWGSDDTIAAYSSIGNPYGFTSQRFDPETGLLYYKARYYSPEQGWFINRDPIGIWGDAAQLGNPYAYVANRPFEFTDPDGMRGCYNPFRGRCWSDQWSNAKDGMRITGEFIVYDLGGAAVETVSDAGDVVDHVLFSPNDGENCRRVMADWLCEREATFKDAFAAVCYQVPGCMELNRQPCLDDLQAWYGENEDAARGAAGASFVGRAGLGAAIGAGTPATLTAGAIVAGGVIIGVFAHCAVYNA